DPSDPGQRAADLPGGTNVLGLPADRLYVSIDGFCPPRAASADNPACRSVDGCTPPAGLDDVAGAGADYAHSISVAFACYAVDPSACGPDSGLYVQTSGSTLTFEWHLVLDSTSTCRTFQL